MTKYIIILSAVMLLSACNKQQENKEVSAPATKENEVSLTDAQFKNSNIETGKMTHSSMGAILKVSGKIDVPPQNLVSISVPSGGYLKSTKLLEGMYVTKGQVLCVIEDRQFIQMQEDYLMAKAKIGYAKTEYERQRELNKSKASSDKVYQQAQTEYNSLLVLVQSYAEKLRFAGINANTVSSKNILKGINVYSPINGYVSKVNVNIGKYVLPSEVLFEIVNPADIHLALNIFEKDINKLYIGQTLTVYSNNDPDKKYPCKIILIGKSLNEDKSVEVHCHFEQYDKSLLPGMYMNAEINIDKNNNGSVLPTEAVVQFEGKNYVFTQSESKKYEMQEVTVQNTENGLAQISFSDHKDMSNSTFVLKGAYTLLMKMKNREEE